MLKGPGTTEPSLVKNECQWQEERQADPSLKQQPLDVAGKSEVLGGLQEASEDNTRLLFYVDYVDFIIFTKCLHFYVH